MQMYIATGLLSISLGIALCIVLSIMYNSASNNIPNRVVLAPGDVRCTVASDVATRMYCPTLGWSIGKTGCFESNCNHRAIGKKRLDRFSSKEECETMKDRCIAHGLLKT